MAMMEDDIEAQTIEELGKLDCLTMDDFADDESGDDLNTSQSFYQDDNDDMESCDGDEDTSEMFMTFTRRLSVREMALDSFAAELSELDNLASSVNVSDPFASSAIERNGDIGETSQNENRDAETAGNESQHNGSTSASSSSGRTVLLGNGGEINNPMTSADSGKIQDCHTMRKEFCADSHILNSSVTEHEVLTESEPNIEKSERQQFLLRHQKEEVRAVGYSQM